MSSLSASASDTKYYILNNLEWEHVVQTTAKFLRCAAKMPD